MTRRRAAPRAASEVLVCGTGYTGEDGVELLCAPERAPRLWDELVRRGATPRGARRARHAAPGGLLSPLRQRPERRARPDRSRARLVLQGGHRLHRRRAPCAPCASAGPAREARRLRDRRARHRAPGQPDRGRRRGHERHALAVPRTSASAWPTCPPRGPPSAPRLRDRRSWQDAPRRRQGEAALPKGLANGRGQLPDGPALPRRARLGADRPRRPGAGHARHHLVRPGRARRGRVLRPARGRARSSTRTRPTRRSSRSRPSRT